LTHAVELDVGLVVGVHGRHLVVRTPEGRRVLCHLRGKRSEAVVGDRVRWQPTGDEGVVEHIEPRRNLLFRQDEWRTKSFAANLDALLILVAVDPPFAEAQLARALIAASDAGVPAWIGLNKMDLPGKAEALAKLAPYARMGVPVRTFALKSQPDESHAALWPHLQGRTTLVLGPSGMGKSTLINRFVPHADAQVGEISAALRSGRHTTTTTTWYALGEDPNDGALIDSPGFQAFGLHQVAPTALAGLMPDLAEVLAAQPCRFYNCTHRQEPGCAVRDAAQDGRIAPTRYRLYTSLFEELSSQGPR
jgi:ribosome biogenesis GTPase